MYFVYILKSENFKKSYVGHTDNLERRVVEHNAGKTSSTKPYRPWKIIYTEKFVTLPEAIERERFLKGRSGRRFLKNVVFV